MFRWSEKKESLVEAYLATLSIECSVFLNIGLTIMMYDVFHSDETPKI